MQGINCSWIKAIDKLFSITLGGYDKKVFELQLQQGMFKLDIGRIFVTIKLLKLWSRLPEETLDSSSWEVFWGQVSWTSAAHGTCVPNTALRQDNELNLFILSSVIMRVLFYMGDEEDEGTDTCVWGKGWNNPRKYFYLTCVVWMPQGRVSFLTPCSLKEDKKGGRRGNLSLLNREWHSVLYPDRLY